MQKIMHSDDLYPEYYDRRKPKNNLNYKPYLFGALLIILLLIFFIIFQKIKLINKDNDYQSITKSMSILRQENAIFRTINPIKSSVPEIIKQAAVKKTLVPGWVTRVYSNNMKNNELSASMDLGSFVMNETNFSLTTHKNYGIENLNNPLYQMNGLYASNEAGMHQISINSQLISEKSEDRYPIPIVSDCKVTIRINNKTIINHLIKLSSNSVTKRVITGQIELKQGVFPISSKIYCDKTPSVKESSNTFNINFRGPSQFSLSNRGLSVYHVFSINE
jgi:hypothetical protein